MMFHMFDSSRCPGAAVKFISCTVNLCSLSMEEVSNVHKIEVPVITSGPESVLTALGCWGSSFLLRPVPKIMKTSQVMKLISPKRIFLLLCVCSSCVIGTEMQLFPVLEEDGCGLSLGWKGMNSCAPRSTVGFPHSAVQGLVVSGWCCRLWVCHDRGDNRDTPARQGQQGEPASGWDRGDLGWASGKIPFLRECSGPQGWSPPKASRGGLTARFGGCGWDC